MKHEETLRCLWKKTAQQDWQNSINIGSIFQTFNDLKEFGKDLIPSSQNIFRAFGETTFNNVRVVVLGQDPYPKPGDASGLAFGIPEKQRSNLPDSLKIIFEALKIAPKDYKNYDATLNPWAKNGILLLNTSLTLGDRHIWKWRPFMKAVLSALEQKPEKPQYICIGCRATTLARLRCLKINPTRIFHSYHPTPRKKELTRIAIVENVREAIKQLPLPK